MGPFWLYHPHLYPGMAADFHLLFWQSVIHTPHFTLWLIKTSVRSPSLLYAACDHGSCALSLMTESSGLCLDPDIQKLMYIVGRKKSHHLQPSVHCVDCPWNRWGRARGSGWLGLHRVGKPLEKKLTAFCLNSVQDKMFGKAGSSHTGRYVAE